MHLKYNKSYVPIARGLRKNMTPEEKRLWYDFLKKLPVTVNRQKNIGDYIVDFFIYSHKLVIEVDGAQHESNDNKEADRLRDAYLEKQGIRVVRIPNRDINQNFYNTCNELLSILGLDATSMKH